LRALLNKKSKISTMIIGVMPIKDVNKKNWKNVIVSRV